MNSSGSKISFPLFVVEVKNNEKDRKPEEEEQVIPEDERPEKSKHVQRKNRTCLTNNTLILLLRPWNILYIHEMIIKFCSLSSHHYIILMMDNPKIFESVNL